MVEYLRPRVSFREQARVFAPSGVPQALAAFVGVTEKGKLNEPILVSSLTDFQSKFGSFFKGHYLPYSVFKFFSNGGGSAYIVRVLGAGNAKSSATISSLDSNSTLSATALSEGAWGNSISIQAEKFSSTVAVALAPGAFNSIVLSSVAGLEVGDIILIDGGAGNDKFYKYVYAIDVATNTVTFDTSYTVVTGVPAGSTVKSISQHRAKSKLKSNVAAGAITQVEVEDASGFRPGMLVTFMDGSAVHELVIEDTNGNFLTFASSTFPALTASSSVVISQEFQLKVLYKGSVVETFDFLSLSSSNSRDFIENKLKGDSSLSSYVEISDLGAGDLSPKYPAPGIYQLSGGLDGAVPTDADYLGDSFAKTGMYALDKVDNINFFAIPGLTSSTAQSDMIAYAEQRSSFAVLDMPLAYDTGQEMLDYKKNTLNSSSSYAAIYGPWQRSQDPENRSQEILLPPSGYVMGMYARVISQIGIHQAPANQELFGTIGPVYLLTTGELDLLDPAGINPIISSPGRGIRVMGSNTLHTDKDGLHEVSVRFVTNFIKESLRLAFEPFLYSPNNDLTRTTIANVAISLLAGLEQQGALVPPIDGGPAFVVLADETNNTRDDVLAQRLNVFVGFVPVLPIKYIDVIISVSPGGVDVQESA